MTIDAPRAGLGCDAKLNVTSDGPLKVTIGGCDVVASAARGRSTVRTCVSRRSFVIHLAKRVRGRRVTSARVSVAGGRSHSVRGKRLALRISLRGRPRSRIVVRIVSRLANGRKVVSKRAYLTCTRKKRGRK